MAHGFAANLPAAVIYRGTTPEQVVISGTLQDIAAKSQPVQPPALFIAGEVAKFQQTLNWYEQARRDYAYQLFELRPDLQRVDA